MFLNSVTAAVVYSIEFRMFEQRIKLQPVGVLMRVMYEEVSIGVWAAGSVGMLKSVWEAGASSRRESTISSLT
jgi:hypothetical protein